MELLKIHPNGQWTLVKASGVATAGTRPGKDEDYKSYRSMNVQGQLPEDYGTKGQLHNVGTVRSPRSNSKERMEGKVPHPTTSYSDDRNPGVGP
jgi:hypothetical protein